MLFSLLPSNWTTTLWSVCVPWSVKQRGYVWLCLGLAGELGCFGWDYDTSYYFASYHVLCYLEMVVPDGMTMTPCLTSFCCYLAIGQQLCDVYTGRAMCSTACKRGKSSGNRQVVVRVRVSVWPVDLDVLSGTTIPHIILLPHIIFFVT